jgi:hypothetical protein
VSRSFWPSARADGVSGHPLRSFRGERGRHSWAGRFRAVLWGPALTCLRGWPLWRELLHDRPTFR